MWMGGRWVQVEVASGTGNIKEQNQKRQKEREIENSLELM